MGARSLHSVLVAALALVVASGQVPRPNGVDLREAEPRPTPYDYVLPLHRPVVDLFRTPSSPWGPGNRGWEFASEAGDPVVAVGSGVVLFAGWVAGRGVVTLAHPHGLLSSVTGLSEVSVLPGEVVRRGVPIGSATVRLHLGFRRDGVYIDPGSIYGLARHAVLVPVPR